MVRTKGETGEGLGENVMDLVLQMSQYYRAKFLAGERAADDIQERQEVEVFNSRAGDVMSEERSEGNMEGAGLTLDEFPL